MNLIQNEGLSAMMPFICNTFTHCAINAITYNRISNRFLIADFVTSNWARSIDISTPALDRVMSTSNQLKKKIIPSIFCQRKAKSNSRARMIELIVCVIL